MRKRAAVKSVLSLLVMLALPGIPVLAAEDGDTVAEITQLLGWFLAPGNNPTAAAHQRFWADDLVYTRSTGLVRTKADIMAGFSVRSAARRRDALECRGRPRAPVR